MKSRKHKGNMYIIPNIVKQQLSLSLALIAITVKKEFEPSNKEASDKIMKHLDNIAEQINIIEMLERTLEHE